MKFNEGDIVVVGGNFKSIDSFIDVAIKNSMLDTSDADKNFKETYEQFARDFSESYKKMLRVRCIFSYDGLDEYELIDSLDEPFHLIFYDNEFRHASDHEKFLYYILGSDALRREDEIQEW